MVPDPSVGGDTGSGSPSEALIFVSDASAEAERLTSSLRARGYLVVDVPLSLLVSRVTVQQPSLVLCDADAPGAIEAIERMRESSPGGAVEVVFLGQPAGVIDAEAARVARQSTGLFVRPVNVPALLQRVEALVGPPTARLLRPSASPAISRVPVLVAATRRPYRYDTRARSRNLPGPLDTRAPTRLETLTRPQRPTDSPRPASSPDGLGGLELEHDVPSHHGGLSSELEALLGRAEQRVIDARVSQPPERLSPEAELESVLPHDLLAALDEPLDELDDEEDDDLGTPGTPGSHGSDSNAARLGSRSGHDSTAGTSPGGSVNPFAHEGEGPGSLERAQPAPSPHRSLGSPPRNSERETTGFGTVPPGRNELEPRAEPSMPVETPGAAEAAYGDAGSEPFAARQQLSTAPPRARNDGMAAPLSPRSLPPSSVDVEIPNSLREGDAVRVLARAVRARYSGAIAFEDEAGIRRVVFRDGDFVIAAAGIEHESLTSFLGQRGDLGADVAARLGRKLPQFGRHAGAALIAQGHLRQEDLWPVLRAHSEWLTTHIASMTRGVASLERVVPPRLSTEPSVFGGATGAEVLIEVVRRAISPSDALAWLGGNDANLAAGEAETLLAECALAEAELEVVRAAPGASVGELLARAASQELSTVLFTLVELGVLRARTTRRPPRRAPRAASDTIDHEAVRARIHARRALVEEGDYFALLGVSRNATSYDIRRAYTSLRQEFDAERILTPLTADLGHDLELILEILDEAFEILRDGVRRERYRRALEDAP